MSARIGTHEIRNPVDAREPVGWPIEGWIDPLNGRCLRPEYPGQVSGGHLIIGNIPRFYRAVSRSAEFLR